MENYNTAHEAARSALEAGLSTIPPRLDGSKAPIAEWKQYQQKAPTMENISQWYGNGQTGIGLVCGKVSGNLECIDFDTHDAWKQYKAAARPAGLWDLLARVANGYAEQTPNGFHLLYQCDGVGGNTKLAQMPDETKPNKIKTLIETRGNGGFIITAPSSGKVNPDGDYVLKAGGFNSIVTITKEERQQLHTLAQTFDKVQREEHEPQQQQQTDGSRPGDEYIKSTTWKQVLEPHGWIKVFQKGETTHWRRPGKKQGESATTNINGSDLLYVFSTSTVFDSERGYNRFSAYTLLNHNGDFKAATRALGGSNSRTQGNQRERPAQWPEITPLNTTLPPVKPFNYKLLPDGLAAWVQDITERTQCPPDFVAVTAMVSLASLIGRKVSIYPKERDDWQVTCNLWGALIGRPSVMKTPAMREGMRPLKRLAVAAVESHQEAMQEHEINEEFNKQNRKLLESDIRKSLKTKNKNDEDKARNDFEALLNDSEAPIEKRYIINDATIEKLGELLNQNPNGLLLERDELTGWLRNLDREDRANDRAFYLECFNGAGSYTYDRIGRGTLHIESTTVSLIGGLQPSRLRPYVWHAINQSAGDDGLIQRIQLAVFPDDPGEWRNVDRYPDKEAKAAAFDVFKTLDEVVPADNEEDNCVHFDKAGQQVFNKWRHGLEHKVREPGIHPAIESHLTKYRSLMPSIALIINEVEQGHCKPVTELSAKKAAAWCQYLESHAMRIYGGAIDPAAQGAELVLERRGKLPDGFSQRNVQRKGWAGLSEPEHVKAALDELLDCGYLMATQNEKSTTGGRPSCAYFWNPGIEAGT